MKKQLILALLGLAVAGGANAASIAGSATGSGNLFFTAYDDNGTTDTTDDRAYVRNLSSLVSGGSLSDWASVTTNPTATLAADKQAFGTIYSVAADAVLSSFLSGSTASSNIQWNIAALDSNGTDRILTTVNGNISAGQTPNYTNFRNWATTGDIYLAAVNPALAASNSAVLNGASASISKWGNNMGGRTSFNTAAGLGGSLNMYLLSEKAASGSTTTLATVQQYTADGVEAMQWNLSTNGLLTYGAAPVTAPVPEPETYAMLLAGLGLMAGISRRRLNKK